MGKIIKIHGIWKRRNNALLLQLLHFYNVNLLRSSVSNQSVHVYMFIVRSMVFEMEKY